MDVQFRRGSKKYCAELKVVQTAGSTSAIREALGQLLEYNYYPGRESAECWVILLDQPPAKKDIEYVGVLREKPGLPLSLGWQTRSIFRFAEGLGL